MSFSRRVFFPERIAIEPSVPFPFTQSCDAHPSWAFSFVYDAIHSRRSHIASCNGCLAGAISPAIVLLCTRYRGSFMRCRFY